MGKKHKHPEHENLERWLVSYADFITLLFATFVVLYALSQLDLAKFKDMSKGVRMAFKSTPLQGTDTILDGSMTSSIMPETGNSLMQEIVPKYAQEFQMEGADAPPSKEAVAESLNETVKKIEAEAKQGGGKADGKGDGKGGTKGGPGVGDIVEKIKVSVEERGVVISLASSFFFKPGEGFLTNDSLKALDSLAPAIKKAGRTIHVEGHTDNQPISSPQFPSNWELSSARAASVVRYLIKRHGFDPRVLVVVGYASNHPIDTNASEQGRQHNRRVDIVLLNNAEDLAKEVAKKQDPENNKVPKHGPEGEAAGRKSPAKAGGKQGKATEKAAHGKTDKPVTPESGHKTTKSSTKEPHSVKSPKETTAHTKSHDSEASSPSTHHAQPSPTKGTPSSGKAGAAHSKSTISSTGHESSTSHTKPSITAKETHSPTASAGTQAKPIEGAHSGSSSTSKSESPTIPATTPSKSADGFKIRMPSKPSAASSH